MSVNIVGNFRDPVSYRIVAMNDYRLRSRRYADCQGRIRYVEQITPLTHEPYIAD
jgi:hypothetical protein